MSGMDRLTDELLEQARRALDYYEDCANQLSKGGSGSGGAYDSLEYDGGKLARDVMAQIDAAARELLTHRRASQADPAPSDGLREAVPAGLVEALRSGRQADMDGVMVTVSRQACEMAADILSALTPAPAQEGEPRHD